MAISDYIVTIGLEVHCQIKTKSKMFCSCETGFGFEPNTRVCPTCLGLPGALPVLNEFAIERTLLTGLMLGCSSPEISQWDRKNYFYPDMAKNYQTSQLDLPLCLGGEVPLYPWSYPNDVIKAGVPPFRTVKLTRIHLEEDAAKITHHATYSLIDYNRAGSALMEIVSDPDIDTPEEAYAYLKSLQQILNYGDISDADMEKGQMRCDVNISLTAKRPEGAGRQGGNEKPQLHVRGAPRPALRNPAPGGRTGHGHSPGSVHAPLGRRTGGKLRDRARGRPRTTTATSPALTWCPCARTRFWTRCAA